LRTGFTTLLVVAALAAVLYAIGVGRGEIDMDSDNQLASFSDFLLSGFGSEGDTPEYVTPMTSTSPTTTKATTTTTKATTTTTKATTTTTKATTTTTKATTTTTKATTTTTKATTTTTKATTTTTKATTTTTKATTTTTKATTTTTKATTTTTKATTTTTPAPVVTTQATTAPTYANASYVVDPNYESPYYIVVYAGDSQSVAVYSKDAGGCYSVLTKCFSCSTGAPESPTRTGQYKIRAKYRWRLLYGYVYGQYSSSISSSYLFHSVPYAKEKENTLDMDEYAKLGTAASHGCIRLCVRDSKWIYDNCPIGTQVNIVNKSGPKGGGVPSLNYDTIYKGWDPSDPHADNPYNN